MLLERLAPVEPGSAPLCPARLPRPVPGPGEVLVEVSACGVCHTELDEIEGRTPPPRLPVVPGHEIVGRVVARGKGASRHAEGTRVGIGWIHDSDGSELENLSPRFRATGRDVNGGYAEYVTVPERCACPVPGTWSDVEAAPLLCAGAVGYRALCRAGIADGDVLGLTGFGGSAHIVLQLARHLYPASPVYVFARGEDAQAFALEQGADWSGATDEAPPQAPRAIIDTTPAWRPVLAALAALRPGGRLVINAIRKEAVDRELLAGIDYARHLWLEKELTTVANVTAADIAAFLPLAAEAGIRPRVEVYPLAEANRALVDLKTGNVRGAKVLRVRA